MNLNGMDRISDFPDAFAGFKYQSVDENVRYSVKENHFLLEPKHDNMAVDSFLGLGMENMGISSKMEEFSHGFDFNFLTDYHRGLDSCTTQDEEAGLKLEILDGFLDEVEDIYASHDGDPSIPETGVKKKVSEIDGFRNLSSEPYSPGISGSKELSEWSKETVPHAVPSEKVKDSLDNKPEDDNKPLSTFIGPWNEQGKNRKKKLLDNNSCSRLDSFDGPMSLVTYDFRPRKKYIHTTPEDTLSEDDQRTSSESEDEITVRIRTKSRNDRRKNQRMWTVDEVVKLIDGISHFGVGKWTDIKNLFFHSSSYRTPIDIRDKWRNLLKASYSDKYSDGEAEERRRSTARLIPKDILHRVREVALIHPYSYSKSPCFVHDSSRSRSTSRKNKKKKRN